MAVITKAVEGEELEFLKLAISVKGGDREVAKLFDMVKNDSECAMLAIKYDEILKISKENGWTIAHEIARYHPAAALELTKQPEILKLKTKDGTSVAYAVVYHPEAALAITKQPEILRLVEKERNSKTIAHIVVRHPAAALELTKQPEILRLKDNEGWTVAHEIAFSSTSEEGALALAKQPEILELKTKDGNTVAHQVARHFEAAIELLKQPEILELEHSTVARQVADTFLSSPKPAPQESYSVLLRHL